MKLLNIKLYGTHYKDTTHKAQSTMWFVDHTFFVAYLSRTDRICRSKSSVVFRRPHSLNISETTGPIEAKDYVKPSQDGETKVCINDPGHITKIAAMPIYGQNCKILLQNR